MQLQLHQTECSSSGSKLAIHVDIGGKDRQGSMNGLLMCTTSGKNKKTVDSPAKKVITGESTLQQMIKCPEKPLNSRC